LTSHPEAAPPPEAPADRWSVKVYRTFDDLRDALASALRDEPPDVLVHCAAVSDYLVDGVYAPEPHTRFRPADRQWVSESPAGPTLADRAAGKVKSDEPELWLRMVRAPKLIDLVRTEWGFRGTVVKFKLEVGVSDEQLLQVAEHSRQHSAADLMVANTLEGSASYAFLGPLGGTYERVGRARLADRLVEVLEESRGGARHG
jgi:phosphopantothenoylcysteine synthetase/decarboxylase